MSEKKNVPEEAQESPGIQIVTVGVKNSHTEVNFIEPAINVLPPVQPTEEEKPDEEERPPHSHLGQREEEERIREHVEEVMHQIEPSESQVSEEVSGSNVSKSESSIQQEKQSEKEEQSQRSRRRRAQKSMVYESADQRRQDLPISRKCFNKQCTSKKIHKKIRSRVQKNKYRFFCKTCYENYDSNLFCEFCQQIYSTNGQNQDDDKWIGCDHCDRWNHIECQRKFRDKNIYELRDKNLAYDCYACSEKSKTDGGKVKKVQKEHEEKLTIKQKIEINRDQRTLIFHKKIENFPNLEYFLQNYSFRLWINESQIREDIQHLRNVCLKTAQQDAVKNKFKKVKVE